MNRQSSYFHRHWMYIFYGLTPTGQTSNRWVSPEARLILEVTKARDALQKNAQYTKEAQITFQGALWVFCQNAPWRSCSFILALFEFSEKIKIWWIAINTLWEKSISLSWKKIKMASYLGSMTFEPSNMFFLRAWMWTTNLKAKMKSLQNSLNMPRVFVVY